MPMSHDSSGIREGLWEVPKLNLNVVKNLLIKKKSIILYFMFLRYIYMYIYIYIYIFSLYKKTYNT